MPDQENLDPAARRAAEVATQEAFERRCAPPKEPSPNSVPALKPLDKEAWERFVQRCADAGKPLPTPEDDIAHLRRASEVWTRTGEPGLCVHVKWLPVSGSLPMVEWFVFPDDLGPLRVSPDDPDVKRAAELVALAARERTENEEAVKSAERSRAEYRAKQEKVLAARRKEVESRGA